MELKRPNNIKPGRGRRGGQGGGGGRGGGGGGQYPEREVTDV